MGQRGLRKPIPSQLHGFSAQTLVLPSEDPAEFHQLLAAYLDDFHPNGPAELDLVHQMVAAKWRLDRLALIENQLFTDAIQHEEDFAADHGQDPLTPAESLTEAFRSLANSPYLTFLHRTESRLERSYSRALRNLLQLQRLRQPTAADPADVPPPENQICKNEPTAPALHHETPTIPSIVPARDDMKFAAPLSQVGHEYPAQARLHGKEEYLAAGEPGGRAGTRTPDPLGVNEVL